MSGPFGSSQWMYASGGFYNGVATQSLRFDNARSTHLKGTLSASFNTYTFSAWIKRSAITASYFQYIFSSGSGGLAIGSTTSHTDKFYVYDGTTAQPTDAVYRDASGWYHVVLSSNSGTGVLYVNGVSVKTGISCASTSTTTNYTMIGYYPVTASALYFDGYMAEVNFIDGTAIGDSDTDGYLDEFGELKNGVWIPKAYTGSYGTNGFRLQFNQTGTGTGSTTTVGADSANSNHFDSSGIDTEDCDMPDSPENNFCTYNPLDPKGNDNTFSEGNLKVVVNAQNTDEQTTTTFAVSSGKWYWEHRLNSTTTTAGYFKIGLRGTDADGSAWTVRGTDGETQDSSGTTGSSSVSYTTGNVIGVYLDMDNGKWYVSVDGVLQNSADLTSGTGFLHSNLTGELRPFILNASSGGTHTGMGNFGQDSTFGGLELAGGYSDTNGNGDFHSSVFSGYLALCTANLPEPTISPNADTQADDYFNTALYTGTNATQSITGVGFQPDWVWLKSRSNAQNHRVFDVIRGTGEYLETDTTDEEGSSGTSLTSFDSDGFSLGGSSLVNTNTYTYVSWNWKAGGTAVSNEAGTIISSVSANTDAGFSICTFSIGATGSKTVGHGLNFAPEMVIVKGRTAPASHWFTYHKSIGATKYLTLNGTGQASTLSSVWDNTEPTNEVFTMGSLFTTSTYGAEHLAYCFHSVEGYSKFGSYIGNGVTSGEGVFAYLGFRPAFIIIKNSSATSDWLMVDSVRSTFNEVDDILAPDATSTEADFGTTNRNIDFVSNGFKIRSTAAGGTTVLNTSGNTYVYMAFAEAPFKYANAR